MIYILQVKYVPPYKIAKHFNLEYDFETKNVRFTKEEGTQFENKDVINELLVDMILNREKYRDLVEDSSYLEVTVKGYENNRGHYDDQLIIKF